MSYTEPRTVATGYAWMANHHRVDVLDNFAANPPHMLTTKGDLPVATAANTITRLPVGTSDYQMLESRASEATGRKWVNSGRVPIGGILIWSGLVAAIPTGWHLCNGLDGTPDLRNRFVLGALDDAAIGDTGGANTIDLYHRHAQSGDTESGGAHTHTQANTVSGGAHNHLIPAYTEASVFSHLVYDGGVIGTANHGHVHEPGGSGTTNTDGAHAHANPTTGSAGAHTHTVTAANTGYSLSASQSTLPRFIALCYVMRMS